MIGGERCPPVIGQELRAVFSASRQKFVTSLLLGVTQSILALHWAPYWYTCNTCHTGDIVRSPDVGTRA